MLAEPLEEHPLKELPHRFCQAYRPILPRLPFLGSENIKATLQLLGTVAVRQQAQNSMAKSQATSETAAYISSSFLGPPAPGAFPLARIFIYLSGYPPVRRVLPVCRTLGPPLGPLSSESPAVQAGL